MAQYHRSYDRLIAHASHPWAGLPHNLADGGRPYDVPHLHQPFERDKMLIVAEASRVEDKDRAENSALLYWAGLVALPLYLARTFAPLMLAGVVMQMVSGNRKEKREAAWQLGRDAEAPKPKRSYRDVDNESEVDSSLDEDDVLEPKLSLFALPALLMTSAAVGWSHLVAVPSVLVLTLSSFGRRGLHAGLRALQAVHQHSLASAMPKPTPLPTAPELYT